MATRNPSVRQEVNDTVKNDEMNGRPMGGKEKNGKLKYVVYQTKDHVCDACFKRVYGVRKRGKGCQPFGE